MRSDPNYRVRFETKDGSLIMNRISGPHLVDSKSKEYWGDEFREIALQSDALEHGVKILSYKQINTNTIVAVVDYLKSGY